MIIYPELPGLAYSVVKRPIFSTGVGTTTSLNDLTIAFTTTPIWEFDLTYDYLPDFGGTGGLTSSDLKGLMGFFLEVAGGALPFGFRDPDDFSVVNQAIGVGDGVTTTFTFQRSYGGAWGAGTEPIGLLDTTQQKFPTVYLDGVSLSSSLWGVTTTTPVQQLLTFATAPAAGEVITADFQYFYWVRFKDDQIDFEKFMNRLWAIKKLTLRSRKF